MLAAVVAFTGCSNRYLLISKFVAKPQAPQAPEILETPTYLAEHTKIKTVAVRAPDGCSNRTTDESTGSAISKGAIMRTTCGVEMAELEKKLAKAGYRVISWKVLEREMSNKVSATEAAGSLGAEALFQINSLERSQKHIGKDALWEREFYDTNESGAKIREHAFDDPTRAYFKKQYFDQFESNVDLERLAITLDANAVFVKTGESIWYYRWTYADPAAIDYRKEVLVKCKSDNRDCADFKPRSQNPIEPKMTVAGESEAVSVTEKPEDKKEAMYAQLLSTVMSDLVRNFSK
ncbi:hypothetical protein [Nitrospira sp. KM1]|uniref:hypothetical protein n=1 Tax=Nitrospira sp. KM1 TaxID=1936990 RepID=UPI0015638337|nr:hypothetical protein [Nitrospira sp. KM1]